MRTMSSTSTRFALHELLYTVTVFNVQLSFSLSLSSLFTPFLSVVVLLLCLLLSQETDCSTNDAHNGDYNSINNTLDTNNSTQFTLNNFAYPTNTQVSNGCDVKNEKRPL